MARIVDSVLVDEDGADQSTELYQRVTVAAVAGETRSLDREDGADATVTDCRQRPRGLTRQLLKLCDLIELTDCWFLVDPTEDKTRDEQCRDACAPPKCRCVRGVSQFDVVDVVCSVSANILLGEEIGGPQGFDMIRIDGRKQLSDE